MVVMDIFGFASKQALHVFRVSFYDSYLVVYTFPMYFPFAATRRQRDWAATTAMPPSMEAHTTATPPPPHPSHQHTTHPLRSVYGHEVVNCTVGWYSIVNILSVKGVEYYDSSSLCHKTDSLSTILFPTLNNELVPPSPTVTHPATAYQFPPCWLPPVTKSGSGPPVHRGCSGVSLWCPAGPPGAPCPTSTPTPPGQGWEGGRPSDCWYGGTLCHRSPVRHH